MIKSVIEAKIKSYLKQRENRTIKYLFFAPSSLLLIIKKLINLVKNIWESIKIITLRVNCHAQYLHRAQRSYFWPWSQAIERVASVYCRIEHEFDRPSFHAIVLRTNLIKYYSLLEGNERRPKGDAFGKRSFPNEDFNPRLYTTVWSIHFRFSKKTVNKGDWYYRL